VGKPALWGVPDAEVRKRGERKGLDTPVVHAVNDADLAFASQEVGAEGKPLSPPPGDYARKGETQRN